MRSLGHHGSDQSPILFPEVLRFVYDHRTVREHHVMFLKVATCLPRHILPLPLPTLRHRFSVGGEHLPEARPLRSAELRPSSIAGGAQVVLQRLEAVSLHNRFPLLTDEVQIPVVNSRLGLCLAQHAAVRRLPRW